MKSRVIITCLFFSGTLAFAQSEPIQITSPIVGIKLTESEKTNATVLQNQNRIKLKLESQIQKLKTKSSMKHLTGGQDGNGGDSALDPLSGKRKLLDLLESDDLNYFIPNANQYDINIPLGLVNLLQRMKSQCINIHKLVDCPQVVENQFSLLTLADYSFLYILIESYGFENLVSYESLYKEDYKALSELALRNGLGAIQSLKWAFVKFDLDEINDEGVVRISNPNTKKQLAIQINGLVIINQNEFELLDKTSQAGLFVHEATLRAVFLTNPDFIQKNGTEQVRNFTRRLIKYFQSVNKNGFYSYPAYGVREVYDNLKIKLKN